MADITETGATGTVALIHAARVDVTSRASTNNLAAAAVQAMGGIDVLVNNAAIYAGPERKGFEDIDGAMWDRVMAVNVKGRWAMTSAVAPMMRKTGQGAVINISSATVMSGSPQAALSVVQRRSSRHDPGHGAGIGR